MRKQDHLLGLINSLTANEKRHFRLFAAQQQDDTNYLKLFDALEGKEQYNATELSRALNISPAQLHNQKNYLAKVLLKSLRFFNDGASPDAYLFNSLAEIEDLIARRLYHYATELLDKALVYAQKEGCTKAIPYIVKFKLSIALTTGEFDEVLPLDAKMQKALTVLKEEHEIQNMTALVAQFSRRRRLEEDFLYHNSHLFKINPESLQSKRALVSWLNMMSNFLIATDQTPLVLLKHAQKVAAIFEADTELQKTNALDYVRCYAWLFTYEANANNYDQAWQVGEKLLAIIAKTKNLIKPGEANHYIEFAETIRGQVAFYQGKYDTSLTLSQHLYSRKQELNSYMQIQIGFNMARALLHMHRPADAITALEELIALGPELRADLQGYIRTLLILAQFQIGNYQIVPYMVRTTRAWIKRQKLSEPGVDLFLSHAYSIAKAPISKRKTEWLKMKETMTTGIIPFSELHYMQREIHLGRWIEEFAI